MRALITTLLLLLALPGLTLAAEGGYPLESPDLDPGNPASLQRGAGLYVNYCMGCHALKFQRYNRLVTDLDIPEELVESALITTGSSGVEGFEQSKITELMVNGMMQAKDDAQRWFGNPPPDLSLIARSRGVDYLYTYLKTFYLDETRELGVNNAVFPLVGMPHAMWELQGWQKPVFETVQGEDGGEPHEVLVGFEHIEGTGTMDANEYDQAVTDLVNFLAYVAEPIKQQRQSMGVWVLLFLLVAIGLFYQLKKEYWKDVH